MMRNRFLATTCGALFALSAATACGNPGNDAASTPGAVQSPAEQQPQVPNPTPSEPPVTEPAPSPLPIPTPTPTPTPTPEEPAPTPAPEPTPTPTPTPETPASTPTPSQASADKFGVTMLHPTVGGGEEWFLADNATADKRFDPQQTITRNADGSWKMKSNQVRMGVSTSTGYSAAKIPTYDRDVLASRGYMQSPNDWKNIEMTGFVKLNSVQDVTDNFDWYARGGHHNDQASGCEGSSYKGGLHYDGRARWQKETWHVSYEQAPYKPATTPLKGRWVGFKAVMRNTTVAGKQAVHLELFVNENADKVTWKKVHDVVDSGNWGGDAQHCGGSVGAMPITWGGPIATFRWDNANDVDFKWLSVREIQPEA
ncbi:carbohydrate-binding protein [Pyxidicoccus parkwayensis]|uniref:Carbohydrate-binding protein n=1 Tax=Pyxidicoccus parkwayensis TaxID=2813578 RepID=A0ABX7P7W9_9BACT|nr:carbohydrate-binding protein [Pyxidicoccus parkwaysis]QSQ26584.1 carbohydrate-binding protein [Pyxidicoccus parkwaysis]